MRNKLQWILAIGLTIICAVDCALMLWMRYGIIAIATYVAIILALPVCSLLHELGHMLFGAMVGIKAVPKFSLFGSSQCRIIPKTYKNLRQKLLFTTCGGLFINALFIVLGFVAIRVTVVPIWLSVFMPASVYLFFLNFLSAEFPSGKTDGMVIEELLVRSDWAKVTLAVLEVQARVIKGADISEIDESLLFDLPQIREDDMSFISLTELRLEYCKAKGDVLNAEKYQKRLDELKIYM
jgi:membrane-associated protease RseP (regulator of RpoE activity)